VCLRYDFPFIVSLSHLRFFHLLVETSPLTTSKIDYEKLAAFAGMTNPKSASNAWAKIKVKLFTPATDGEAGPSGPKTPKSGGRKPKAKATPVIKVEEPPTPTGSDDATAAAEVATPTPKAKKASTPRKRKTPEKATDGSDEAENPTPTKKARGRKSKAQKEAEAAHAGKLFASISILSLGE
jgi:hypothetical protein